MKGWGYYEKGFFHLMVSIFYSFLGLSLLVLLSCGGGGGGGETPRTTQLETNQPPVAIAGPNQNVLTGSIVTLDGSGSYDPNNDSFTYSWALTQIPNGSTAILSDSKAVRPTFIPNVNGAYVARLIVIDSKPITGNTFNEDSQQYMTSEASYVTVKASTTKDMFVAMGGSITLGYLLNNYDDCYVARLSRMWGKAAVNRGVSGATSSSGMSIIGPILSEHNPRYLTLYYGSNDVGFYNNDQIVSNLRFIIIRAKENGTTPVVATLGPFLGQWALRQPLAIELNKKIRQMAAEEGIACADLEAALNGNSAYMEDGMHPNSAGHKIIADAFYKALTQ